MSDFWVRVTCGCVWGVLTEAGGPKGGVRKTARRRDEEAKEDIG